MRKSFVFLVVRTSVLLALCQCQSISSYSTGDGRSREGAVYYLPKTEYQVRFTVTRGLEELPGLTPSKKGETVTIDMTCEPVFVPDKTQSYTLHSSANEFFGREHHVVVQNGLLTTIGVKDDGRLLEIVKLLGDSVSMVISSQMNPFSAVAAAPKAVVSPPSAQLSNMKTRKINLERLGIFRSSDQSVEQLISGFGREETEADRLARIQALAEKLELDLAGIPLILPSLPDYPTPDFLPELRDGTVVPTSDEVKALMLQLTPGSNQWRFTEPGEKFIFPGASRRVYAMFESKDSKSNDNQLTQLPVAMHCGDIRGIVAKNTTNSSVMLSILAEEGSISEIRLAPAKKNSEMFTKYVSEVQEQVDIYTKKGEKLLEEIASSPNGFKKTTLGNFPVKDRTGDYKIIAKARIHMAKLLAKGQAQKTLYDRLQQQYASSVNSTKEIIIKENKMSVQKTIDDVAIVIPLTRGPVGETSHTLTLAQGTMGDWSFKKKSAVEGLVQIPIELAKDIIGIPAAALGIRTSEATAQTDLIEAQTKLTTAQADLLKKQAELEAIKNPPDKAAE